MFYDETKAIKACEEEPSLIFDAIKAGEFDLIDKILERRKVNINTLDKTNCDILTRLLRSGQYKLVLKYMSRRDWNVNNQDIDGNTFSHYLVNVDYKNVIDIIKKLGKKKNFIPNIKNKKGETILDRSINNQYIYSSIKILEDKRFNNIDVYGFKKLFNSYIKNSNYGKYSRLTNFETIVSNLEKKELIFPGMQKLIIDIVDNMDVIKNDIMKNKSDVLEYLIDNVLVEANA